MNALRRWQAAHGAEHAVALAWREADAALDDASAAILSLEATIDGLRREPDPRRSA